MKRLVLLLAMVVAGTAYGVPKDWPKTFKFAIIPVEGGSNVKERFEPLRDHLQKALGIKVELFTASDYNGIITAMTHKSVDAAYLGPKSYVEAANRADAEVMALELNKSGRPGYNGIIIVRADSKYKKIEDTKGAQFAFTDPNSTSGYLVPNILFLRDMKVKPKGYFKAVKFSGSHAAAILAVKNKSVDVAATNDIDFDRMVEAGQISRANYRVLWTSELIPGAAMAVRKPLPASLKTAFQKAVVEFSSNKAGKEKLQNGGFRKAEDKDYDVIRYLNHLKKTI